MIDSDVFKKSISGSKWITINIFSQRVFGFLSFLFLARLLAPSDYGTMAIAGIVINLIDTFLSPSFGVALIQQKEVKNNVFDTVWSFGILRGLFVFGILLFAAPYIADYFNAPEATNVIRVSAGFILIASLGNVGMGILEREMQQSKFLLRDFIGQIFQFSVALIWAIISPSVWALVAGQLAMYLSTVIATYFICDYRPRFFLKFKYLKDLASYSTWVMGQNMISYFANVVDTVFVAKILDIHSVGFYSKSRDLSIIPSSYTAQIANKVGFAAYSKIQESRDMVSTSFIKTLDFSIIISYVFSAILIGYGFEIINILLGVKCLSI